MRRHPQRRPPILLPLIIALGIFTVIMTHHGRSDAATKKTASSSSTSIAAKLDTSNVRIPILVYHHLRPTAPYPKTTWSYKMSVSPNYFETQMKWIADHGYTTIDLNTAAAILKGERAGPTKPIVVTFDDSNLTPYDIGIPILQKYGEMAVFYIITNRLDNTSYITRNKVKQLVAWGMDVESHTVTHASLSLLPIDKLDYELKESKRVLEEVTGKPVLHIAYPSVMQNKTVREHAAAAGYITGTIMDPRAATAKDDLLKLPRIEMLDTTDLAKVLP